MARTRLTARAQWNAQRQAVQQQDPAQHVAAVAAQDSPRPRMAPQRPVGLMHTRANQPHGTFRLARIREPAREESPPPRAPVRAAAAVRAARESRESSGRTHSSDTSLGSSFSRGPETEPPSTSRSRSIGGTSASTSQSRSYEDSAASARRHYNYDDGRSSDPSRSRSRSASTRTTSASRSSSSSTTSSSGSRPSAGGRVIHAAFGLPVSPSRSRSARSGSTQSSARYSERQFHRMPAIARRGIPPRGPRPTPPARRLELKYRPKL